MIFTNRFTVLFTLAVAIAGVSAQNFDACGQACVNSTVADGYCSSLNDTSCVCTNTQFQNTLASCLLRCSSSDLTIAQQLQNSTCTNVTTSTSPTPSGTNSATSSTPSTNSNGATALEQLPLLSAVIVIAGALMGGAFVL